MEDKYPTYPKSYQAGWGYMMLTNFLPNGGNGTYVTTAVPTDSPGNKVTRVPKPLPVTMPMQLSLLEPLTHPPRAALLQETVSSTGVGH